MKFVTIILKIENQIQWRQENQLLYWGQVISLPVPKPNIIYAITGVAECLSLYQVFDKHSGFCYIRYLQFKVWKAGCGFDCSGEKLGLTYSSFIYIAASRKQVEAYTDCVHFSCTMHLQHYYISPTSVILALLCDIFQSTQREVHWWEYSGDLFETVQNTHSTCFITTLETVVSRHPWESEKGFHVWSWLLTGI